MKSFFVIAAMFAFQIAVVAQEDTTVVEEEFDFSDFELAAPPAKSFCTNKVIGQTPTSLIGVTYDFLVPHRLTAGNPAESSEEIEDETSINSAHGIAATTNLPLVSRNNILVNLNLVYQRQIYDMDGLDGHPLAKTLNERGLTRMGSLITVFKPINEKNFFLIQAGVELNGDYEFGRWEGYNRWRIPAALLFGWKPSDRLMYGFGLSRTYLGGALNYVPIAYYYHTFKNEKWGIEAVLPARASLRYRFNSTSLISLGYSVSGASYSIENWVSSDTEISPFLPANDLELHRSELRPGINYQRQLSGFFWISAEVGYRINYSFELEEGGEQLRFFGNDDPYFIENQLEDTPYFTIGITYVSP